MFAFYGICILYTFWYNRRDTCLVTIEATPISKTYIITTFILHILRHTRSCFLTSSSLSLTTFSLAASRGHFYDNSVFPSPTYYSAKNTAPCWSSQGFGNIHLAWHSRRSVAHTVIKQTLLGVFPPVAGSKYLWYEKWRWSWEEVGLIRGSCIHKKRKKKRFVDSRVGSNVTFFKGT